jgi:hypothetical protein
VSQRSTMPLSFVVFGALAVVALAPYAGCHIFTSQPATVSLSDLPIAPDRVNAPAALEVPEERNDTHSQDSSSGGAGLAEIEQLLNK